VSARDITELQDRRFDLVVVGGGIAGCGIARDAALRGFSVLLVERGDFAGATSSSSSKLVHGGLRYLEYFRFHLVRESLHERRTLLDIAPHLVRKLPILLPFYRDAGRPRWKVRAGLTLYDLLAGREGLGRHHILDEAQLAEHEPRLQSEGRQGGAIFHDAQMDDARLTLENALDAEAHGATLLPRVECRDLVVEEGRVSGVVLEDLWERGSATVKAGLVVNAAGPWYARLLGMQSLTTPPRPRLSRGTHIVLPLLTQAGGILWQARQDRRVIFVLPYKGGSLVGTTDLEHRGEPMERTAAPREDIEYLQREVRSAFPDLSEDQLTPRTAFVGLRTLLPGTREEVGEISREAQVREEAPGLLCVLGGKYTTYRSVAQRAVDLACHLLGRELLPCTTASTPLPGGEIPDMNEYFRLAEDLLVRETGLPVEILRYLLGTYGSRHGRILKLIHENPEWGEAIEPGLPFTRAELIHAVREEHAIELDDLLWRRTWRAYLGPLPEGARQRWEEIRQEALRGRPRRFYV
jgi:glycerol-3-phosphate dehydrogenase